MKVQTKLIAVGLAALALCVSAAPDKKATMIDPSKAEFKEVAPGVKKAILWGDHAKGPYGAYTRFDAGLANPLHTHTSDIRIVVLRGAYIYKPQNGKEQRVTAGSFISVPGGDVHTSGGDAKEGALFYEESPGGFDLNVVQPKGQEPKGKK